MSRTLHEVVPEKTPPNVSLHPVMVYMCECGAKWADPLRSIWDCKCGRQLVKRNGVIHAGMAQMRKRTELAPRIVRIAAG